MQKLINIQKKLKAPKGNYNSFGKYKYRSCEDILEAVKPLLAEEGCQLTISDEIVLIGDRYYIKATAHFTDGNDHQLVSAFARESDEKKGMDSSQVTGTASSYARKYALNGLFLIDDTKDADTDEYANTTSGSKETKEKPKPATGITPGGVDYITQLCIQTGTDPAKVMAGYKVNSFYDLTTAQYDQATKELERRLEEKKALADAAQERLINGDL